MYKRRAKHKKVELKFDIDTVISLMLFALIFIGLGLGFITADKSYKFYNFFFNQNISSRILQELPLIFIVTIIYLKCIPKVIDGLALLYWYLFALMTIVPLIIVYAFNGLGESKHVIFFIYLIVLLWIIGIFLIRNSKFEFPQIELNKQTFWMIIFSILIISYIYLFIVLGLPRNFVKAFTNVYDVRLYYRDHTTRFADYFVNWIGNIINPFLFAYAIRKKNYKVITLATILELILYSYTAYKSILVTFLVAPIFGLVLSGKIKRTFMELGFVTVIFIGVIAGFKGVLMVYLLMVLRIFLWPALIALEYYDFFWMYPKMHLAHSSFVPFVHNIYNIEPPFLIAKLYYNRPQMRLNTTWYADAYMNFGIIGLLIFALIIYFMLILIKSMEKKDVYLVASLLFGGILTLFNGPLLTTFLTNGLGLGLVLVFLLPKSICKEKTENALLINIMNLPESIKGKLIRLFTKKTRKR